MNALQIIQQKLKAPKSNYNSFGKYSYRSLEDIQEAVKPLLAETNSVLTLNDEIVEIGGALFVKVTATIQYYLTEKTIVSEQVSAYAMHAKEQKGMNEAQITGAASSYARKYALNGLFLIDDTKDADATNDGKKETKSEPSNPAATPTETAKPPATKDLPWLNEGTPAFDAALEKIKGGMTVEQLGKFYRISKATKEKLK